VINTLITMEKLRAKADDLKHTIEDNIDTKEIKSKLDTSNFDLDAVLRGMQLTLVGAHRALQNPAMFTSTHYKQAIAAVVIGIIIRLIVSIPLVTVRLALWLLSFVYSLQDVTWDDSLIEGLNFIGEYVLQVPFFLMTILRHGLPTLDNLWVFLP
jgi:hypothetical protein